MESESRQEKHERYLAKLEKHVEIAKEASKYSSDRFDVLIISLSTSGLVLSIGFVKEIITNYKEVNTCSLKAAWLFLVIALVSNILSQVTGYYANKKDIEVTKDLIREERGKKLSDNHLELVENCEDLNKATMLFNGLSLISLIIGITLLVIFFSNNI